MVLQDKVQRAFTRRARGFQLVLIFRFLSHREWFLPVPAAQPDGRQIGEAYNRRKNGAPYPKWVIPTPAF